MSDMGKYLEDISRELKNEDDNNARSNEEAFVLEGL